MLTIPCIFLQSAYLPTNALNEIQFTISIKLPVEGTSVPKNVEVNPCHELYEGESHEKL